MALTQSNCTSLQWHFWMLQYANPSPGHKKYMEIHMGKGSILATFGCICCMGSLGTPWAIPGRNQGNDFALHCFFVFFFVFFALNMNNFAFSGANWHPPWRIDWHLFWHLFWHCIQHSSGILPGLLSGINSIILWFDQHSTWHSAWHKLWYLANVLSDIGILNDEHSDSTWHRFTHIFWHSYVAFRHSIWHSISHIFRHFIWQIHSGIYAMSCFILSDK